MTAKHPAKFSDSILQAIAPWVEGQRRVLDPFAGTGKLAAVVQPPTSLYLNEIEPEWARVCQVNAPAAVVTVWDAQHLPYKNEFFTAVVTSPTYGNRMADHHNAKDGSKRHTYTHSLGRSLTPGNSGVMQWGEAYRAFHKEAWAEVYRVMQPGGVFVLNISDHIRDGERKFVSAWHNETLQELGLILTEFEAIETPRQRHGANGDKRVPYEFLYIYQKGQ